MHVSSWWWSSAWRGGHVTTGFRACHCSGHSLCLFVLIITERSLCPMCLFFAALEFDRSKIFSYPVPLLSKPCSSSCTTTYFLGDLFPFTKTHAHIPLTFPCISTLSSQCLHPSHTRVPLLLVHLQNTFFVDKLFNR